jgi:hypothetical protein
MSRIFISYRRDDSLGWAGRLADTLKISFGADQIFMDIATIEPGLDFAEAIETGVSSCDVVLVVIGPRWLTVKDEEGQRRLDDLGDYVRMEIATALQRNIRVIPVLVGGVSMPNTAALPDDLKMLARRQAHELSDQRWDYDSKELISILERVVGRTIPKTYDQDKTGANAPKPFSARAIIGMVVGKKFSMRITIGLALGMVATLWVYGINDPPRSSRPLPSNVPTGSPGPTGTAGGTVARSRPGWIFTDPSKAYETYGFSSRSSQDGSADYCCDTNQWEKVCKLASRSPIGRSCKCPNVSALVDFVTCP